MLDITNMICGPQPILNDYGGPKVTLLSVTDQETLAAAVLQAHKFSRSSCYGCENLVEGNGFKRCVGKETDCCRCSACLIARRIMNRPAEPLTGTETRGDAY